MHSVWHFLAAQSTGFLSRQQNGQTLQIGSSAPLFTQVSAKFHGSINPEIEPIDNEKSNEIEKLI